MSFGKRHYVAAPYAQPEAVKAPRQGLTLSGLLRLIIGAGVVGGLWLAISTGQEADNAAKSAYSACIASASTSADYSYCARNFAGR